MGTTTTVQPHRRKLLNAVNDGNKDEYSHADNDEDNGDGPDNEKAMLPAVKTKKIRSWG